MVTIGNVETFKDTKPDKAQVLKISEEEHEVHSAWEDMRRFCPGGIECATCDDGHSAMEMYGHGFCSKRDAAVDECCDLIMATCNFLASLGVTDIREAMERCVERNRERGRM